MSRAARAILPAGFTCGVLDGICAVLISRAFGRSAIQTFQGIAAGLLGARAAQTGGIATAALGVLLHFVVAFGAAAVYYAVSRRMRFLMRHAVIAGALYGIAVHLFMRFVVTPLSALGWRPIVARTFFAVLFVHIIVVGPSISLTIRRYEGRR